MHTDFESIVSARLRNPLLISPGQPGVVDFRAPKFNTTGHWWEVALSPASQVLGAEFTAIPDADKEESFAGNQGPGHSPPEDSLNFIIIGRNDVPCKTGWEVRVGFAMALGGKRQEFLGPVLPTHPDEKDKLYRWRLEYYPDKVALLADLNEDGALEHLHTFSLQIPWQEVYVHFLGIAYQADHHPQNGSCNAWQGQVREFPWKEIQVEPVKFARTAVLPREEGLTRTPQAAGWTAYDLRDTQRHGIFEVPGSLLEVVGGLLSALEQIIDIKHGLLQPNLAPYDRYFSLAVCGDGSVYGCTGPTLSWTLGFELDAETYAGISRARLVYDIRGDGTATLKVNSTTVGEMPGAKTVPAASEEQQWVRRSLDVHPLLLRPGKNTITVSMAGHVQMDRLEWEFGYQQGRDEDLPTGTITQKGLFIAPASVSKPLTILIRASSVAFPSSLAVIPVRVVP
jgi:hypothetical protein